VLSANQQVTRRHQSARDNGGVEPQDGQAVIPRDRMHDSHTRGVVAHYEHLLKTQGTKVNGQLRSGADGVESLKELYVRFSKVRSPALPLINLA
jgi:hypothetical protein